MDLDLVTSQLSTLARIVSIQPTAALTGYFLSGTFRGLRTHCCGLDPQYAFADGRTCYEEPTG